MKKACKALLIALLVVLACAAGYFAYVILQYDRIEDRAPLAVENPAAETAETGRDYTLLSYNTGFGAYSPAYTFFMDTGVMDDGTAVQGAHAKGASKADVQKNVDGQASLLAELAPDFAFLQEVDLKAHRSYQIDMAAALTEALPARAWTYASNFHTAYLCYPFSDPIGKTEAGLVTLSRCAVTSAERRSFPVTDAFFEKFFDLDRCFAVHRLPVAGQEAELVLINLHMSAYDEGGTVRAQQLAMLNQVLAAETAAGNYVIAGGDFNHCLTADQYESDEAAFEAFPNRQQIPDWIKSSVLHAGELAEGVRIVASSETPTCRGADIPYEKGVNFSAVIDGFIVSDNVEVVREETVDTEFAYSDHNPVLLTFRLKGE